MPPRRPKPTKVKPSNDKNPPNGKNIHDDDNPSKDTQNPQDNNHKFRKVDVVLDEKLGVPPCYTKFFKQKSDDKPVQETFKLTIKVEKKKGKKTSTTVSWDSGVNPFPKKLLDIEADLKSDLGTSCSIKNDSLVLFGNMAIRVKDYFIQNYNNN